MSRNFSNKPKPKVKPKIANTKNIVEHNVISEKLIERANFSPSAGDGSVLFIIMSNAKNIEFNINSTADTWLKTIGKKNNYLFLSERKIEEYNSESKDYGLEYRKVHSSYSSRILTWFLKERISSYSKYDKVAFCTDTSYINAPLFVSDKSHWGFVSQLLPSSIQSLSNINKKADPYKINKYHGEAGFCLSMEIVKQLSNLIQKNEDLILDRWDATIGYCMSVMGANLNHDDNLNLFPYSILNHSDEKILKSKSYGYSKFYDKKNIYNIISNKG